MGEQVQLIGEEPNGLAQMMAAVAHGNLQRDPDLARYLSGPPGAVRITATDAGVSATLEFRDGSLRVYSGAVGPAEVELEADAETLASMGSTPQLGPLPNPFKAEGRAAIGKAMSGDLKLHGAVRGRKLLARMRKLLATG